MSRNKRTVKKLNKRSKLANCILCLSNSDDVFRFGEFHRRKTVSVHMFCAFFASGLGQNGKLKQGIEGFRVKDILEEVKRAMRLRCVYCKRFGATIGCCVKKCRKVFHLHCGQKNGALNQFFGRFSSFCKTHKPEQEACGLNSTVCSICGDNIEPSNKQGYLKCPCCTSGLFHRSCIQHYANSSGYFFKCPLCNNRESFRDAMLFHGIHIPDQDASWETEENAYYELYETPECAAENCLCPEGRDVSKKDTIWFLQICIDCGSKAEHVGCEPLNIMNPPREWQCSCCAEISSEMRMQKIDSFKESECEEFLNVYTADEDATETEAKQHTVQQFTNFIDSCKNTKCVEPAFYTGTSTCNPINAMQQTITTHVEEYVILVNDNTDNDVDVCTVDSEPNNCIDIQVFNQSLIVKQTCQNNSEKNRNCRSDGEICDENTRVDTGEGSSVGYHSCHSEASCKHCGHSVKYEPPDVINCELDVDTISHLELCSSAYKNVPTSSCSYSCCDEKSSGKFSSQSVASETLSFFDVSSLSQKESLSINDQKEVLRKYFCDNNSNEKSNDHMDVKRKLIETNALCKTGNKRKRVCDDDQESRRKPYNVSLHFNGGNM